MNQVSLGPQHPSTHGVLRLIALLTGETVKQLQIEIGLLHRGSEKLIEYSAHSPIPYFNRLDYVSIIAQEEIYCYAIERSINLAISSYSALLRTVILESARLLNHLLSLTAQSLDLGSPTPFL
jgi:NADH:ubiquinone oxidoreductase subunit D